MIRNLCCCFLLTLGAIGMAAQQADPRESRLLVLERLWNEAQVNRDSAALEALVSSRFVNTEWDGELSDKKRFLADIKDPRFKPTAANIHDVKMNFFGDTAVVTGIYHTQGTYQSKPYDHVGRFRSEDPRFKPTAANIHDVKMNFFGDTAVVTGIYHTQGTYQSKPYDHVGRFTDTWFLEIGKWQCVASHTSLVKK